MQFKVITVGVLALLSTLSLFAQPATSHIDTDGFWIEEESDWDSSDAQVNGVDLDATTNPNIYSIVYALNYQSDTAIKLLFKEGASSNHDIDLLIDLGGQQYAMQFDNGTVTDESGTVLATGVMDLDLFYFLTGNGEVYCYRNSELLRTITASAPDGTLLATYRQAGDTDQRTFFEIETFQTPGIVCLGDLEGAVYFPLATTIGAYDPMALVSGVAIDVEHLSSEQLSTVTTGATTPGRFVLSNWPSGMLSMTPTFSAGNPNTGVNEDDLDILTNHLCAAGTDPNFMCPEDAQPAIINCPLFRIAADLDRNGVINNADRTILYNHINNGPTPQISTNWWFVPMVYAFPTDYHPDLAFANNFWDLRVANVRNSQLPFASFLRFNDGAYTYRSGNDTEAWMDKLHEWIFDANPACEEVKWGFYMIRPGDLNGSAASELSQIVTP
ncbi:MAG: hypothetical protein AAFZ63_23830 [Bacteroidota bacterium]